MKTVGYYVRGIWEWELHACLVMVLILLDSCYGTNLVVTSTFFGLSQFCCGSMIMSVLTDLKHLRLCISYIFFLKKLYQLDIFSSFCELLNLLW